MMKLILTDTIDKLGIPGDVVDVRDGYGRNYLIPQRKAIVWSKGAEKQIEGIKRSRDARKIQGLEHAQEVREQLESLTVKIPARVSESGQLFGSVTTSQVTQAVKKAGGPAIDKRSISFDKPVKTAGAHVAAVKLHQAVTAHLPIEVVAE